MPKDQREPQSYGSGTDWLTGRTGQQVNEQKSEPAPEHREFYESRRDSETSASHDDQGGKVSDVQAAENAQPEGQANEEHQPVSKVTAAEGGAKLGGYFKKRDYE
jgi:hypothetical protein